MVRVAETQSFFNEAISSPAYLPRGGVGGGGGRGLASRIPLFGSLWFHLASNVLQAQTPLEERPVRQNPTWQKSPSPQSQLTKVSFTTIPLDKGRAAEMPT